MRYFPKFHEQLHNFKIDLKTYLETINHLLLNCLIPLSIKLKGLKIIIYISIYKHYPIRKAVSLISFKCLAKHFEYTKIEDVISGVCCSLFNVSNSTVI